MPSIAAGQVVTLARSGSIGPFPVSSVASREEHNETKRTQAAAQLIREKALTNHYFRVHEDHVIPPLTDVRSGES
jgi:hypothetical protein